MSNWLVAGDIPFSDSGDLFWRGRFGIPWGLGHCMKTPRLHYPRRRFSFPPNHSPSSTSWIREGAPTPLRLPLHPTVDCRPVPESR